VLDECIYFMLAVEHIGTNKVKLKYVFWPDDGCITAETCCLEVN